MKALPIVFAGPSVTGPPSDRFEWRGPAAAGHLLALADNPARVVVLIDGVFEACASVQHKEILELVSRGFPVLGAASMGALRAAELHAHGMIGVGAVFAAYASGRLTADDEVALLHAPAGFAYRALSEALVDMRATLIAAVRHRIVSPGDARAIRETARRRFWKDRNWSGVLKDCVNVVSQAALARLQAWLPAGSISIKARDATLCLEVASMIAASPIPLQLRPAPPRTAFFRAFAGRCSIALDDGPSLREPLTRRSD